MLLRAFIGNKAGEKERLAHFHAWEQSQRPTFAKDRKWERRTEPAFVARPEYSVSPSVAVRFHVCLAFHSFE